VLWLRFSLANSALHLSTRPPATCSLQKCCQRRKHFGARRSAAALPQLTCYSCSLKAPTWPPPTNFDYHYFIPVSSIALCSKGSACQTAVRISSRALQRHKFDALSPVGSFRSGAKRHFLLPATPFPTLSVSPLLPPFWQSLSVAPPNSPLLITLRSLSAPQARPELFGPQHLTNKLASKSARRSEI